MTTLDGKGQQRHGTSAAWASADPVLLDGEIGWDDTLNLAKKGDGSTAWSSLAFLFDARGTAAVLTEAVTDATAILVEDSIDTHAQTPLFVHGISDTSQLLDTGAIGVAVAAQSHSHTAKIRRELSVPGVLVVGTGLLKVPITSSETLTKATLRCGTAPVGASVIFDILVNNGTVFSPTSNRPTVTAGANLGSTTAFNVSALVNGNYLSVNIVQVGSPTTEGSDAVLVIESTETI